MQLVNRLHSYKSPYCLVLLFRIIQFSLHGKDGRILVPNSVCMEDIIIFSFSCLHVMLFSSFMEEIMKVAIGQASLYKP